jgi:hypothetical protein
VPSTLETNDPDDHDGWVRRIVSPFVRFIILAIAAAVWLSACAYIDRVPQDDPAPEPTTVQPEPTVEPTPGPTSDEPDAEETPEPEPTPSPIPTPIPSGSYLLVNHLRVHQVVVPDDDLGAEYAKTRFTLYRRVDGRTWRLVSVLTTPGELVADRGDPETLYYGDHAPCLSGGDSIPFLKSVDGGITWREIEDAHNIRPLVVLPEDPDVVIGSRCGVAISQDRGETWEVHYPPTGFDVTMLQHTSIGLYGVFTSEGGTSHLRLIDMTDPLEPEFREPILDFWGSGVVHATRERLYLGESRGVHFSDDGGRTWSFSREGLQDVTISVDPAQESIPDDEIERGFGILAIRPHPGDASRIFIGTVAGLYLSEDWGQSWGRIQEIEPVEIRELRFGMAGGILYVTTPDGVVILNNP